MTTKPWLDCPPCPTCGGLGVSFHTYWGEIAKSQLACQCCGRVWDCTPEERARAERADAAWEEHERDAVHD